MIFTSYNNVSILSAVMTQKPRLLFCLFLITFTNMCFAIPQGKIYSVDEEHYNRPSILLVLIVPILILVGVVFLLRYLSRYKDAATEGMIEGVGAIFGILSNGVFTLLKVMLFGLGLFALILLYTFLSRYEPFSNMGVIGEKIMLVLFMIVAFGGPSIYKYLTKKPTQQKQLRKNRSLTPEKRFIDTDEGVVDLGLSVLWTDVNFPLNLTFHDMRKSYLLSNAFRFPTKEELDELRRKCKWEKTYIDEEHFGFKVIGPNGNSIFLQSSYKNDNSFKRELTTYPIYITIYFAEREKNYEWKYSSWSGWLPPYEHITLANKPSNFYVGKILVKDKKV